jgi:dihydrofolate reductase
LAGLSILMPLVRRGIVRSAICPEARMSRIKVQAFTVSIDGYGAGPRQSLENPLGVGGEPLHDWLVHTRTFHQMTGSEGGTTGTDETFAQRSMAGIGAWILGRNMFGPVRGPWPDDQWKGWWGDNPPYHVPVFVLTHHPRAAVAMAGGTTFHFVTGGIHEALERAREAADGSDVRIGGGVGTVRQYLQAGLVDEVHLAVAPILLGSGEALLAGIDLLALGFRCREHAGTADAMHVVLARD